MVDSADTRAKLEHGITAVVPVYNSEASLDLLLERLSAVLVGLGRPFEILLVNDGSTDNSWEIIRERARRHDWLRGINLMRNYGQHNALLCGIRAARYDVLFTLDDDLQNPPEDLPLLLHKLEEGYDVVYGTAKKRYHPLGHNFSAWALKFGLNVALGAKTAKIVSPMRAMRTRVRAAFDRNRSPWVILDVFLTWATTKIASVPVEHRPRAVGKTTYTMGKRLYQAFDLITGSSTLPLRVASLSGFLFTVFGTGVLAYVLGVYFLIGDTVPGWVFLASTISIFSGAQLFALGIVGEYLARMFVRIMERPSYTVAETTSDSGRD